MVLEKEGKVYSVFGLMEKSDDKDVSKDDNGGNTLHLIHYPI